jgi:hypothetical protein
MAGLNQLLVKLCEMMHHMIIKNTKVYNFRNEDLGRNPRSTTLEASRLVHDGRRIPLSLVVKSMTLKDTFFPGSQVHDGGRIPFSLEVKSMTEEAYLFPW